MIDVPVGATHFSDFYGIITFYKTYTYDHYNTVSDEWQKRRNWEFFDRGRFAPVGSGFCDRTLKPIREYF